MADIFDAEFLAPREANHVPLSPVSLINRAGKVFPDRLALEDGATQRTWAELHARCLNIAASLQALGVRRHTTVAALLPNSAEAVELSYAVPLSGGVLNMMNVRLEAEMIAYILDHGEAEVFVFDACFAEQAKKALELCKRDPLAIVSGADANERQILDYQSLTSCPTETQSINQLPQDEWDAIALNYTSGTTGKPKGVVYHHRGAYLAALSAVIDWPLPKHARYLWTLPLFHCNGWCFPWALAATAGVHLCLREVSGPAIVDAIERQDVTHMCGAPIVLNMATTEAEERGLRLDPPLQFMTAGAAPSASLIERASSVGFNVTHVYGLTEVYGPSTVCEWDEEWDTLSRDERARIKARQGCQMTAVEEVSVRDPKEFKAFSADGTTLGEVMFRGNLVMKGYLKDPAATEEALGRGHFKSGDLGVLHDRGYVELKDRSKDIIISGGENISSIEVESALYRHPAVNEVAVVAGPHEKWGETPVAFVELREDAEADEGILIGFARENLAHFKCPTKVVLGPLPKTATGKIQKFKLRETARNVVE